ncbi:hypothetical protein HZA86_00550 [Candidatus Uhrbacteria bacterium]|nr:hypothetical protein [Candidatus Uhrbacteria bacterium]
MRSHLPQPLRNAMIYQDDLLYACLATHPITRGGDPGQGDVRQALKEN